MPRLLPLLNRLRIPFLEHEAIVRTITIRKTDLEKLRAELGVVILGEGESRFSTLVVVSFVLVEESRDSYMLEAGEGEVP